MSKECLMTLYGPLESDARVLRSLEAFREISKPVTIITCNTREDFAVDETVTIINYRLHVGMLGYFYFCLRVLSHYLSHSKKYDMLYLQDFFSTVPGVLMFPFARNKRMIYDAHELILPDEHEKQSFKNRFFVRVERLLVKKVECVIEANEERSEIIKKRYSLNNVFHVLNISKLSYVDNHKEISDNGDINIVYQGMIAEKRKLSFFIDCMQDLPRRYKLILIGDGEDLDNYKKLIIDKNLQERVSLMGRLGNKEMLAVLDRCHFGIISYPTRGLNYIYCAPNKIFEYAVKSIPFISTNQPFFKKIEHQYNTGRTFEEMNKSSFIEGIQYMTIHYGQMQQGFKGLLSDYNYSSEHERLVSIIRGDYLDVLCS